MNKFIDHENRINQWHETGRLEEAGGVISFLKLYEPDSYEIKNELSWLLSAMLKSCDSFVVPTVKEALVEKGFVKMDFIESEPGKPLAEIIDYLVQVATELHSLIKSEKPHLRNRISASEYPSFLQDYTKKRIDSLSGTQFELPAEISEWLLCRLESVHSHYFSIVHRDLRTRHLLFPVNEKPTKPVLVDWEFSNISEPAQDVAKLIYDVTVLGANFETVKKKIVDDYAYLSRVSAQELEEKINAFLPLIPLERDMSLIARKPEGYEKEILRDLFFVRTLYEEK